jgi:hypothetical protein
MKVRYKANNTMKAVKLGEKALKSRSRHFGTVQEYAKQEKLKLTTAAINARAHYYGEICALAEKHYVHITPVFLEGKTSLINCHAFAST